MQITESYNHVSIVNQNCSISQMIFTCSQVTAKRGLVSFAILCIKILKISMFLLVEAAKNKPPLF